MAKPAPKEKESIKEAVVKSSDAARDSVALTSAIEDQAPAPPEPVTEHSFDVSGARVLLRDGQRYAQHALTKVAIPEYAKWIKDVSEFLIRNG